MIISKTPFRISLFGGGTDYPAYYKNNKSTIIGFAFNRYNYILFRTKFLNNSYKFSINYSRNEKTNHIKKIKHRSVRETLKYFNFKDQLEIHYNGELPSMTGLGTSSAFTVGLCKIMNFVKNNKITQLDLAKQAIDIEQNRIKEFVGSQDQILTALGGLTKINFYENNIQIKKFDLKKKLISEIENSSILIFTGLVRKAESIEKNKFKKIDREKIKLLDNLVEIAEEADQEFMARNFDLKKIGSLLDESWKLKRSIHKSVSNNEIDELYIYAKKLGAYGGKILGAGGGGFLYLICPKEKKELIKKKLKIFKNLDIKISKTGSEIISSSVDYF